MSGFIALFPVVLNMSLTAGVVILFVLAARALMRRTPKVFSYALWSVVLLRLLCPFSFSSGLSLFQALQVPVTSEGILEHAPVSIIYTGGQQTLRQEGTQSGIKQEPASPVEPVRGKAQPWELLFNAGAWVWLSGTVVILFYGIFRLLILRKRLTGAVRGEENIYLSDYIRTPFVMGIFSPRIYLPTGLAAEERAYILMHERIHIKRGDYIFRLLGFLALAVHWFNPLVWAAYYLSGRDMEMSCDEAVLRKAGRDIRKDYSASLLNLSAGKRYYAGAPLGFGLGDMKSRILNVMRYKKPAILFMILPLAAVAVLFVALGSNPVRDGSAQPGGSVQPGGGAMAGGNGTDRNDSAGMAAEQVENGAAGTSYGADKSLPPEKIPAGNVREIEITAPALTDESILGAEGTLLDYADEELIIFHDYYGLFVYNMKLGAPTGAVDLAAIGCQDTQGDNYCEVTAEADGSRVYLHPASEDHMYVYDVRERRLTRRPYSLEGVQRFEGLEVTWENVKTDHTVFMSHHGVDLGEGRFLYLMSGSGLAVDLSYVIERDSEWLENESLFRLFLPSERISDTGIGHRDGYQDTALHLYIPDSVKETGLATEDYFLPEVMERQAQQALRELYDMTGTQLEECWYFAYDSTELFVFAQTKEDLERGRIFFSRCFTDIRTVYMTSRRSLWYSPVDMFEPPAGYADMSDGEKAVWFVTHSGLYNGQKAVEAKQPYEWDLTVWHVTMEDGTAYEVDLDTETDSLSNLAGPYPDSDIQH